MTDGSYRPNNTSPILVMIGTADEYGNYQPQPGGDGSERVYWTAGSTKILVTIAGGTHLGPYIGTGAQADTARAAVIGFLNVVEANSPSAHAEFDSDVSSNGLSAEEDLLPSWFCARPSYFDLK